MKKIAVIDCETDPAVNGRVPEPFIWGYYDGENYEQFDNAIDLVVFLYTRDEIVYAHNGGKFDYHFLLDFIDPYSDVMIISGRIAKFCIGDCEFRDSLNIIPTALSAFEKDDFDYSLMEKELREIPENRKKIERYLYSDCINLYNYVMKFIDKFGINLTVAGTALKEWQKISGLKPPNDENGELYARFKKYYYGGRCQAFRTGIIDREFSMVDINSAYPYAMLRKHPYSTKFISLSEEEFCRLGEDEKGPCLVSVRCLSFGALPVRNLDNSLSYPDDNVLRVYHVTGWELLAGLETKTIKNPEIIACYSSVELQDFSCYMNRFYNERLLAKKNGDKAESIFCKLMMNSLYGKFSTNPSKYKKYKVIDPAILEEEYYHDYEKSESWLYAGPFGSNCLVAKNLDDYEKNFYNIATAASITGFVRGFLWRAMCACDDLIYCDTDSIAAEVVGGVPNGFGDNLGQWSVDGEFSGGGCGGRKMYAFRRKSGGVGYKTACKGANLSAKKILEVASGKTVTYKPDFPTFTIHKEPYFQDRKIKMTKRG